METLLGKILSLIFFAIETPSTNSRKSSAIKNQGGADRVDRALGLGQQFQGGRGEENGAVREVGRGPPRQGSNHLQPSS